MMATEWLNGYTGCLGVANERSAHQGLFFLLATRNYPHITRKFSEHLRMQAKMLNSQGSKSFLFVYYYSQWPYLLKLSFKHRSEIWCFISFSIWHTIVKTYSMFLCMNLLAWLSFTTQITNEAHFKLVAQPVFELWSNRHGKWCCVL